ncbi:MAG: hypothetical protein ACRDPJ_00660 [Nocardioidaceae bacterium]
MLWTFGRWRAKQPFPGITIWRSPAGAYYLADHTGTHPIRGPGQHPAPRTGQPRGRPDPVVEVHHSDLELVFADHLAS